MMKFKLGKVCMTPGVAGSIQEDEMFAALNRHVSGDWGEICEEDKKENDFAVDNDLRILSGYTAKDGTRFWIITEADRSITTVLLPQEY